MKVKKLFLSLTENQMGFSVDFFKEKVCSVLFSHLSYFILGAMSLVSILNLVSIHRKHRIASVFIHARVCVCVCGGGYTLQSEVFHRSTHPHSEVLFP